jgi:hypothetical protein
VNNYRGPGLYRHYKGGLYDVFGLALWEPMAGKSDNEDDLSDKLLAIAANSERGGRDLEDDEIVMLRQAAKLLSEDKFVIYEPMSPGSFLEDIPGVQWWARGKHDFDSDVSIPDAKGIDMTTARFTFATGHMDPTITGTDQEIRRLKQVIRKAHNDLNDPGAVEAVRDDIKQAMLLHKIKPIVSY